MTTQNEPRPDSILRRVRWDVISGGAAFSSAVPSNVCSDEQCGRPLSFWHRRRGGAAPLLRTDARKVIKGWPVWGVPMTDDDLPDIGQVTTEVLDGLRIRIARGGRPDGSAILFTSPWPESIYAFHRVFPYFVETHRVIAIDLPGYGYSESRPDV